MEFDNKTIVITGASSGIGLATAKMFLTEGSYVYITGRSQEKLRAASEVLSTISENFRAVSADVSNETEMQALFKQVEAERGSIDCLFANAGINGTWGPVTELTVDQWEKTYAINCKGTFLTIKYAVPLMRKSGGCIVIDASINGTRCFTNRGATAYASSKAAVAAMGKMLALELAADGIRVNVICPGATYTDIERHTHHMNNDRLVEWVSHPNGIIPLSGNRWASADDVANAVVFICSEKANFITGAELFIDGGMSLTM